MTNSPIDRRSFGQRLARIRDKRGLGQEELAALVGVVQGTISNWERAVENKFPGFDDAIALARALNVSLDELAGTKPTTPVPLTLDEPLFFVGADVPRLLADIVKMPPKTLCSEKTQETLRSVSEQLARIEPNDSNVTRDQFVAYVAELRRLRRDAKVPVESDPEEDQRLHDMCR